MKDGPVRRAVKGIARRHAELNLSFARALARRRGERPHDLAGECRRCARCCEAPAIQVGRLVWYSPLLGRLFLLWQERINGFAVTGRDPRSRTFVFACSHFDPATRACDSYGSRPLMCRDYPRALLWQANPELFAGCGYRAVAPNAAGLLAVLAGHDIPPERQAELRRRLRLEP